MELLKYQITDQLKVRDQRADTLSVGIHNQRTRFTLVEPLRILAASRERLRQLASKLTVRHLANLG